MEGKTNMAVYKETVKGLKLYKLTCREKFRSQDLNAIHYVLTYREMLKRQDSCNINELNVTKLIIRNTR